METWDKQKNQGRELYIVTAIGLLILLLFGTGVGTITINGEPVTDYENMAPILITVINVICGALAIVLSLHTIPNEYARRTSHLVWIREVSQPKYHGELALASAVGSLLSEAILYLGLLLFMIMKGRGSEVWRWIPAFLIVSVSILLISLFTSVLSVILPDMLAGTIAAACYLVGILHGLLDTFRDMAEGIGSILLKGLLLVIPDLNEIRAADRRFCMGQLPICRRRTGTVSECSFLQNCKIYLGKCKPIRWRPFPGFFIINP